MRSPHMFAALLLLVLSLSALPTQAEQDAKTTPPPCQATPFPFARQQSKRDFKQLLDKLPRQHVVEYFFHELSAPKKEKEPERITPILGTYLIHTEQNKNLRSLYQGLAWATHVELSENCKLLAKTRAAKPR